MAQEGKSLRTQANRRMLLVALIAGALLFTFGALSYQLLNKRELALRHDQIRQYYTDTLPRQESARQLAAEQLVSRLEFSRILEAEGESRWPMLKSYLDAQWAFNDFSNMVILDAERQVLYGYGSEVDSLREWATATARWLYQTRYRQFYAVYRMPLWLGVQGQGQVVLFRSLSNSLMRDLAIPQTHLQLVYNGQVMASSQEGVRPELKMPEQHLRVDIPWAEPRADGGAPPVLVAYRDQNDIYPFSQFVARPVMATLVIVGLLWFGLGRWLSATTLRIAALGQGAPHYAAPEGRPSLAGGTPAPAPR